MHLLVNLYRKFVFCANCLQPVFLLAIRLFFGYQLMTNGYRHLNHLDSVTEYFQSLNIPMPYANAVISAVVECVGGALWMLGLGTRAISLGLVINFCVAYWKASPDAVKQLFSKPDPFLKDDAFPFWLTAIILLAFGPGLVSIDYLLKSRIFRNKSAAPASDS